MTVRLSSAPTRIVSALSQDSSLHARNGVTAPCVSDYYAGCNDMECAIRAES